MDIKKICLSLALNAAIAVGMPLAHAAPGGVSFKPLINKDVAEMPGKELMMISVEYAPGGEDPVHRHDAHGIVYVLEGSIVMGVKGGKEVTLKPGDTFYEGPADLHTVGRNASKTKPAKFVVFLLKEKQKPVLIPAQ
jgi:quercetin dioxygenase-like cupin family protein